MTADRSSIWAARGLAFVVWAAAATAAVAWGLRVVSVAAERPDALASAAASAQPAPDAAAIGRLLGAGGGAAPVAAAPDAVTRYRLLGVLAAAGGERGAALMSVGGKPPRHWRVGAEVEPGVKLVAVEKAGVRLSQPGGRELRIELPKRQP
ncbi:MAG: hypothetical protein Fur0019_14330 [Tibeticola sp.]